MAKHFLDEKTQGEYHFTIGPYARPVLMVEPGDEILIETIDTFAGRIKNEETRPHNVTEIPFLNPQNGPIFINGAKKGDALVIKVNEIKPRGPQPRGTTCIVSKLGLLAGTDKTVTLEESLPEVTKKTIVTDEYIEWNKNIRIPYKPFLGTIGTAPQIDSLSTLIPDRHGGNMDLPEVGIGSTLYLPVNVDGALLFLGDCHAVQGDGEICGNAVEIASTTTIQVDVRKGWRLMWPRLENKDHILSIGSARPLEDAVRIAYGDLIEWMVSDFGFDKVEAYLLLSQVGKVRLGNVVDPNYTVGAMIKKEYLSIN